MNLFYKIVCLFLITLFSIFQFAYCQSFPSTNLSKENCSPPLFNEDGYLAKPDHEIDLSTACLLIEKKFITGIAVTKMLEKIDKMTYELNGRILDTIEPLEIIAIINDYLFKDCGLEFDENYHFLYQVLTENKGNCSSLSYLYVSIAQRLDLPFFCVMTPLHMFVRYDDGKFYRNIETTKKGKLFDNRLGYVKYPAPPNLIDAGVYLKNLTTKQTLASELNWRGIYYNENEYYDLAIRDFMKALVFHPNMPEVYASLAKSYKLKGDLNTSLEFSNIAIALYPDFLNALSNRGDTKMQLGDENGALEDYNRSIELDPKNVGAHAKRGEYFFKHKEYEKALKDHLEAISLEPDDPQLLYNLGTVYFYLNDHENTKKAWIRAMKLGSTDAAQYLRLNYPDAYEGLDNVTH